MEFYQIITRYGETLVDIAMREYGFIDGVHWLLEDNPNDLVEFTDTPPVGITLNVRVSPDTSNVKALEYVRKGKEMQVIKYTSANLDYLVEKASCSALDAAVSDAQFSDCLMPNKGSSLIISGVNNSLSAAEKKLVKEGIGNYYERVITIKAGSRLEHSFRLPFKGYIKSIDYTNVSAYTVRLSKTTGPNYYYAVAPEFSHNDDDILYFSVTPTNAALDCTITVKGYYDTLTVTSSAVNMGGDGRYLYVLNYVDQTVSVIDTGSNTVSTTITLPAACSFSVIVFNPKLKRMYLFGSAKSSYIDADPASGTFNNVYSYSGVLNGTTTLTAVTGPISGCYVPSTDTIWVASPSPNIFIINCVTGAIVNDYKTANNSYTAHFGHTMTYIRALDAVSVGCVDLFESVLLDVNTMISSWFGKIATKLISIPKYLLMAGSDDGSFGIYSINPIKKIAAISVNIKRLGFCYTHGAAVDYIIGGNYWLNQIYAINAATLTTAATINKANNAANELGTRDCIYSPYSDRVYAQAYNQGNQVTGVNRIHIINPNTNTDIGYITVGNLDASSSHTYSTCQIAINNFRI